MGPLGEIFNPGMRHELEERRSKELRREEEGNATKGGLRIDLDAGFVHIIAPGDVPAGDPATADSETEDSGDTESDLS